MQLDHLPGVVLDHVHAGDEVGVAQPDLAAGRQPEELPRGVLAKVVALDVEDPREGNLPGAHRGVLGIVHGLHLLDPALGVVVDHHPQRAQHRHHPGGDAVELLPHAVLEQLDVGGAVVLGHPHLLAEPADRLRRVAPPAKTRQGGHARVVPPRDVAPFDQVHELSLGHDRVAEVEPGELDLPRMVDLKLVEEPVVQGAMVLELQRAQRMRDAFDGVRLAVGEVVGGVDAPRVSGAVVRGFEDAIHHRIAQVQVWRGHVDLRPEGPGAVLELAGPHPLEEAQVLLDRPVVVGALLSGSGERSAILAYLLGAQVTDVGLALLDQPHREVVELLIVAGGEVLVLGPVEPQPADVVFDGLDESLFLLGRVRVVEAQMTGAAVLGGDPEVETDRLGVPDVQVAVGLRRKAGDDAVAVLGGLEVLGNDLADEVEGSSCFGSGHGCGPSYPTVSALRSARQRRMRLSVASRPRMTNVSKIAGLTGPPLTAIRSGWATLPSLPPACSSA